MKIKYFMVSCTVLLLLSLSACSLANDPPETTSKNDNTISDVKMSAEEMDIPLKERVSKEKLSAYFEIYDNGSMVLSDGVSQVVYNEPLSTERHSPYSTFKIPNSLIALEEGVVTIDDSLRQWDGTKHSRAELNQNQDLASAMKYSCVWYYQQLAKEVGENAMQGHLKNIGYGNMDLSGGIDQFWLDSSLLISPQEQLAFMIRLYHDELPFSQRNMEYVRSIMKQEGYPIDLHGKTGSSGRGHGWFVGYALLDGKPYFFATYIEGKEVSGLQVRDKTAEILIDFFSE